MLDSCESSLLMNDYRLYSFRLDFSEIDPVKLLVKPLCHGALISLNYQFIFRTHSQYTATGTDTSVSCF